MLEAWLAKIAAYQPFNNALNATTGGILAAFFGGRKTPVKLILSGIVAAFFGWHWGGFACEWAMSTDQCSVEAYKAFSSGIGVISWPLLLLVPELPNIAKKWITK